MRSTLRTTILGALTRIGRSRAAPFAVRALVVSGRLKLQPMHRLSTALETIVKSGRATTVIVDIELAPSARASIECDLQFQGYRELALGGTVAELSARLFALLARDAEVAVDIGSNAGVFSYSAVAAAPNTRVIAFEPTPALAELLRRNAERNGWTSRLVVREQLVGAHVGETNFYVLASDFESTADPEKASQGDVREVLARSVTTLDAVVDEAGIPPARILFKIDVEGYEAAVIDGGSRTLTSPHPPEFIIEFLSKALKAGALESMVASGYNVWYVASDRLISVRAVTDFIRHQDLSSWNFYCTRRPPEEVSRLAAGLGVQIM